MYLQSTCEVVCSVFEGFLILSTSSILNVTFIYKLKGTCGSCWSYGATGTIEGAVAKNGGGLVALAQQNLMDCSWKYVY